MAQNVKPVVASDISLAPKLAALVTAARAVVESARNDFKEVDPPNLLVSEGSIEKLEAAVKAFPL